MDSLVSYTHRKDLSPQRRMLLAYVMKYQKYLGQVTKLGAKYKVSRTFLYANVKLHEKIIADQTNRQFLRAAQKLSCHRKILIQRLVGNSSLEAIQTILEVEGSIHNSLGYISEFLRDTGRALGQAIQLPDNSVRYEVAFASDEIFGKTTTILITVEPISNAILRIEIVENRGSIEWQNHWQGITNQGVTPSLLLKDEGIAMKAAHAVLMPEVPVQSDTFHAVSHRLGLWITRLEAVAFGLMLEKEAKERLFYNAKTTATLQKRLDAYDKVAQKCQIAIDMYHNFTFLYHNLLQCFQAFDNKGQLKVYQTVLDDFHAALDLAKTLHHPAICKAIKTIESLTPSLFTFINQTQICLKNLSQKLQNGTKQLLNKDQINAFCSAWQWRKNAVKAKKTTRKNVANMKEKTILEKIKTTLTTDYQIIKDIIYNQLDHNLQSSAAVENINSILRPFLNSVKNQVTQEALNLFMFYHNHRIFKHGKRKGSSPMQILSGQQHEHWLDLILQKIAA